MKIEKNKTQKKIIFFEDIELKRQKSRKQARECNFVEIDSTCYLFR